VENFKLFARFILQGKDHKIQVTSSRTIFIAFEIGLIKLSSEKRWFKLLAPEFYIQILAHPVCKM
jgi:hypothetical protein